MYIPYRIQNITVVARGIALGNLAYYTTVKLA